MAKNDTQTPGAQAADKGVKLKALSPIRHNGENYNEGDELPPMPADQAQQLIDLACAVAIG